MREEQDWSLSEEVGGLQRLTEMMRTLYERIFDDLMIGFMFVNSDLDEIVAHQVEYSRARLGNEQVSYTGASIRRVHQGHPILIGHFNRRHQLLKEVLREYEVPEHVYQAWVELELSLRALIVRTGGESRDELLRAD